MHRGGIRGSYDGSKIAGLYDLEETLGRGHFAVVKLARHVFTGEKVAVKVIDKTKLDEVSKNHLFQEVRCMKLVQHPNVVRLYEVIDTNSKLYLILELADGGDLYDYIMRHESGLSESVAQEYFSQIVRAISYCHRLHVVHRDLKPENVVFFERIGVVKLTDFGFSNKFCPGQKLETSCGSLAYSAPEILLGDSYDAPAVDIWSLGVILYMLVCGQAPFQEANDSETLTMIMDCKYTIPNYVSEDCKRLIARMLVRQPERRATLEEIANDPWLRNSRSDTAVPLISRQNISDEDHSAIIEKMINGGVATKEQILEALDKNAYNHITATYYLLAERKLRAMEPKNKFAGKQIPRVSVDSCSENEPGSPSYQNNYTLLGMPRPAFDIVQRARKCSIVAEEEDEDEDGANSDSSLHSSLNRRGSRSEGKLNLAVQEIRKEAVAGSGEISSPGTPVGSSLSSPRPSKMLPAPLVSARSSPQLGLDEIAEDGTAVRSGSSTPRSFLNFEQRRSRFRKSRTASCSSSEASGDEDSEGRKKRGSTKSLHRQRDPRDPSGNGGPSAGGNSSYGSDNPPAEPDTSGGAGDVNGTTEEGNLGSNYRGEGGRRHCLAGTRRRRVETRLRESQSLNRITEVQEYEIQLATCSMPPPLSAQTTKSVVGVTKKTTTLATTTEKMETRERSLIDRLVAHKHRFKRNAIIDKCLNLQRKICVPLLKKGRLYKTQSCSEVQSAKDINQNLKPTLKITN